MATIRLFGVPEVVLDSGQAVSFRSSKAHELLAFLALKEGGTASRSEVARSLWPELETSRQLHNLRQTLVYVRQGIPDAFELGVDGQIALAGIHSLDLAEFRDQREIPAGQFLEGMSGEWVEGVRDRLEREVIDLLLVKADAELHVDPVKSLSYASSAVDRDPFLDRARRAKLLAMKALGESAAAVRELEAYRKLLKKELGIDADNSLLALVGREPAQQDRPPLSASFASLSPRQQLAVELAMAPARLAAGRLDEGRRRVSEALMSCDHQRDEGALAYVALSRLSYEAGDYARALGEADLALESAKASVVRLGASVAKARALLLLGRTDEADALAAASLPAILDGASPELKSEALVLVGVIRWHQHRTDEALALCKRGLKWAQRAQGSLLAANALAACASCYFKLGLLDQSTDAFEKAIQIADRCGAPVRAAHMRGSLGRIFEASGNPSRARELFQEALSKLEGMESPTMHAHVITYLAELEHRTGRFKDALNCHAKAAALRRVSGDRLGLATSLRGLGRAALGLGQAQRAQRELVEALRVYGSLNDRVGMATAQIPLAEALIDLRHREEALRYLESAESVLKELDRSQFAAVYEDEEVSLERIAELRAMAQGL